MLSARALCVMEWTTALFIPTPYPLPKEGDKCRGLRPLYP